MSEGNKFQLSADEELRPKIREIREEMTDLTDWHSKVVLMYSNFHFEYLYTHAKAHTCKFTAAAIRVTPIWVVGFLLLFFFPFENLFLSLFLSVCDLPQGKTRGAGEWVCVCMSEWEKEAFCVSRSKYGYAFGKKRYSVKIYANRFWTWISRASCCECVCETASATYVCVRERKMSISAKTQLVFVFVPCWRLHVHFLLSSFFGFSNKRLLRYNLPGCLQFEFRRWQGVKFEPRKETRLPPPQICALLFYFDRRRKKTGSKHIYPLCARAEIRGKKGKKQKTILLPQTARFIFPFSFLSSFFTQSKGCFA